TQFRGADHSGVLHFTSGGADDRRISRGEEFQNQGLNSYNGSIPFFDVQREEHIFEQDGKIIAVEDFFAFYALGKGQAQFGSQEIAPVSPLEIILRQAAKHFASMVGSAEDIMLGHLRNMAEFFRLDEELLLMAIVILRRYTAAARNVLSIQKDSELFYLMILCIVIAYKGLLDSPINTKDIAVQLKLEPARLFHNEIQILNALDYNLFFCKADVADLGSIFPIEGLMSLSFSSEKPDCSKQDEIPIYDQGSSYDYQQPMQQQFYYVIDDPNNYNQLITNEQDREMMMMQQGNAYNSMNMLIAPPHLPNQTIMGQQAQQTYYDTNQQQFLFNDPVYDYYQQTSSQLSQIPLQIPQQYVTNPSMGLDNDNDLMNYQLGMNINMMNLNMGYDINMNVGMGSNYDNVNNPGLQTLQYPNLGEFAECAQQVPSIMPIFQGQQLDCQRI
ncbi:MAG: hypothetical protein EZS28_006973, partial [Streblomastix strix]